MNAKKYYDQFMALEEAAKNEIIELLKNNPAGSFIEIDGNHNKLSDEQEDMLYDTVVATDGDDRTFIISAVGLNADNSLIFKGNSLVGGSYKNNEWFELDEWTHVYWMVYEYVVNNLVCATHEPFKREG